MHTTQILDKNPRSGYIATTMKKTLQITNSRVIVFLVAVFVLFSAPFAKAEGLSNGEIEAALLDYSEPGYQYLDKLGVGMWKVLYARPDWRFGWEVVITTTSTNPENSILVVGTSVLASDYVNSALMLKLLDENSYDNNPGNFSIYFEDGIYYVQYALKTPQMLMNETALLEAIGFVAGYTNSKVGSIEKFLYSQDDVAKPVEKKQMTYSSSSETSASTPAPVPAPASAPVAKPAPAASPEPVPAATENASAEPVIKTSAPASNAGTIDQSAEGNILVSNTYYEDAEIVSIDNVDLAEGQLLIILLDEKQIAEVEVTKVGFLSSKARITTLFINELDKDVYLIGNRIKF